MIPYEDVALTPETQLDLDGFRAEVETFRVGGPLDKVSLNKLEEHFRAAHVYHSAGIEGNRLTLQETMLVLKDGLEISGKPLKDSLEARHLGEAFDYLQELAKREGTFREADLRDLHKLVIGDDREIGPGEYRRVGVIISGSEHRPPEPLEIPSRVSDLVAWVNANFHQNPIIVAALAHHELAAIHPFKDGNGRVSRLLMNLILGKAGYPISNLRRDNRPAYYEALAFADVGIFDPLVRQVKVSSAELFSEYLRIRDETRRTEEWARKWGTKEKSVQRRREQGELELWLARVRQVFLEFQNAAERLNEQLGEIRIDFYDYRTEIDFDRYQKLLEKGSIDRANAFSVTFSHESKQSKRVERFMFRYYRNSQAFQRKRIIPLELNYLDKTDNAYVRLSELPQPERLRLRSMYFNDDGSLMLRTYNVDTKQESDEKNKNISDSVIMFYDDVLQNIFGLKN